MRLARPTATAGAAVLVAALLAAPASWILAAPGAAAETAATQPGWLSVLLRAVAGVGVAAVLAAAGALLFEDRLVFRPSREPADDWRPGELGAREVEFPSRDGCRLHGLWLAGSGQDSDPGGPVLLYCHGNAGNLTHRAEHVKGLAEHGFGVFIFDYRGYGRSEGSPEERALYLDAEAAYLQLTRELGVAPRRVLPFGRSLGGTVALHVGLRCRVAGVIVEGAIRSVPDVARQRLLLMPLAPFCHNRFDSVGRARHLRVPLLVVHGTEDAVVPFEHGQSISAAARNAEFYAAQRAGHEDAWQVCGEAYYERLRRFCARCMGSPA
jgi:hypothetical protein